ncbi:MAG: apolipoprotein N-acyltransferase [Verrucomicrobia bacterium TMED56]|nr:MAG: apolipoprotein N-acyltransferase [Verrucomicrobia bacterium TMED56]
MTPLNLLRGHLESFMRNWLPGFFATGASFLLLWWAQPPNHFPEAAYFFLIPCLLWLYSQPDKGKILLTVFVCAFLYSVGLVGWIRHVSLSGMLLASIVIGGYYFPWFYLTSRWIRAASHGSLAIRLSCLLGLSSLWVLVEWMRSSFTLGFPWCPLSVSQWERPAILQLVPFAGGWIVSFFLVFFNLSLASYLHHLLVRRHSAKSKGAFTSMCPEFYLCMFFFLGMLSPILFKNTYSNGSDKVSIRVGICQPYLLEKWSPENIKKNKQTLIEQTKLLGSLSPDLIVWPEASTPYAVNLDRQWVEDLSKEVSAPILAGAIVKEPEASYNCVVKINPDTGLDSKRYSKQILVPFGEFIPFPFNYIPGIKRLVGPVGEFSSGKSLKSFTFQNDKNETLSIIPIICYEDIFPDLFKDLPSSSHTMLFVTTNDAWFGEEGCAEQHAAHSVMRALECGMPVLRCGNAGWSGWITPKGSIRTVLLDEDKSVYFRGASVLNLEVDPLVSTFYKKNGNYFVALCFVFVILSSFTLRKYFQDIAK